VPGASGPKAADAHLVGCVDHGERALEAAHLLRANVGLAAKVVAKQVVLAVLDCGQLVVLRSKLVCVVAEERALAGEEVVARIVAQGVEVGGIAAGFALAWGSSASSRELVRGPTVSLPASNSSNEGNRSAMVEAMCGSGESNV
jgi:hypothetical protein